MKRDTWGSLPSGTGVCVVYGQPEVRHEYESVIVYLIRGVVTARIGTGTDWVRIKYSMVRQNTHFFQ